MDKNEEQLVTDHQVRSTVHLGDGYERETKVVEDLNAGRRLVVSRISQLIWLLFGVIAVLIGLRALLKLFAANPSNPFASLLYSLTDLFMWPFSGLTATPSVNGMVLEIPAFIAIVVYALVGWVIVQLVWLLFYNPASRRVQTIEREQDHSTD